MFWKRKNRNTNCNHKYKDFPWYVTIESVYPNGYERYRVSILEPYVCIHCGNRINKELAHYGDYSLVSSAQECKDMVCKKFSKHIMEEAVVEDMINDTILVDQQYLKYYELIKSGKIESPKLEI